MQDLCWINGTFTFEPHISAQDRGLLLADGLFETIRVERGEVADFEAHFARLSVGLKAFEIGLRYGQNELLAAAYELMHKATFGDQLGRLRLTVTRGAIGGESTAFMSLVPYVPPTAPLELVLTDIIRVAGNPSSQHKTLAYTDNMFAQRKVEQTGKNRIAVLCNQWGRVACASIGNVFVKVGSEWLTPTFAEGALPGITRAKLLRAGAFDGLPVREGEVTVDTFLAGEALLTNVLRKVERAV